jgi:hypothetical protein
MRGWMAGCLACRCVLIDPSTPVRTRHGCRRVLQAAIGLYLFAARGHPPISTVELLNSTELSVSRVAKTWNDESDIV